MKTKFIASMILAGLAAPSFAEPTLYGKANLALQNADEGDESVIQVVSNASRIGVKGDTEVDGGLKAIYQAEFEVQYDDGDKSGQTFSQRNIFVGLEGGFGTVKGGNFDTPLKVAQKKVDLFNDLEGDIKNMITPNDNRESNIVNYLTPSFGGFVASVAYVAQEDETVDDGVSTSFSFSQDALYVALAFDQNVEAEEVDVVRLVGQYNFMNMQVGGLFETVDNGVEEKDAFFVSFKYSIDALALKVQHGSSDLDEEGGQSTSIGADYKLAKKVKVFTYFTNIESDFVDPDTGTATDNKYIGAGIEYKF